MNISGGKAISYKYVSSFFMKGVYSFRKCNCTRELIPNCWHSHRENTSDNIQLSFRNTNLFGKGWSKGPRNIREM